LASNVRNSEMVSGGFDFVKRRAIGTPYGRRIGTPFHSLRAARRVALKQRVFKSRIARARDRTQSQRGLWRWPTKPLLRMGRVVPRVLGTIRARELQAEYLIDEIVEIADTPQIGVKTIHKPTGTETTEGDMIEHRRLRVDARKWVASKLAPKKYGEKVTQEHVGDPANPVAIKDMTARELPAIAQPRRSNKHKQKGPRLAPRPLLKLYYKSAMHIITRGMQRHL
jgi:hypothetical protein